jgi:hypothetical protein
MRHFVEVSQLSEELLKLNVEEFQAIVGADELNVANEEIVWECILRWVNSDADNRKTHTVDLMKNIRTGLLDKDYFNEKVSMPLKNMCVCMYAGRHLSPNQFFANNNCKNRSNWFRHLSVCMHITTRNLQNRFSLHFI